ncbi:ankyrin repeat domain-containing protein [Streptomyces sp. NPDC053253]|uniref:ankyrin repeat domain-containing protein n=1 Tax=Streptomyces sp. NPDC053253 TaxID=3365699 RepID=UPI0037D8A3E9
MPTPRTLRSQDPLAVAVTEAVRSGDLDSLRRLLAEHPGLAAARVVEEREGCGPGGRSLLHLAADWPGHVPRGPETVAVLVAAGADPGARFTGAHRETPLHWAASNDDVPMIDALVAAGADIEADGAVIADGTPLADARAFGQWRAAHRLLELGARPTFQDAATLGRVSKVPPAWRRLARTLAALSGSPRYIKYRGDPPPCDRTHQTPPGLPFGQTALLSKHALGLDEVVEARLSAAPPLSPDEVNDAFWGACQGGRLSTAVRLRASGADLDRIGWGGLTPLDIARTGETEHHAELVTWLTTGGARTRAEVDAADKG